MSEHLTQIEIYEVAAGEPVAPSVTSHSVSCAECAAEVSATRRVIALVERLEPAAEAGTDLDQRLARRLDAAPSSLPRGMAAPTDRRRAGRARSLRRLAGAAAAVICFAAGVASHAVWSAANRPPVGDEGPGAEISQPLTVQQAGTDYVAAIAMMVADSGRLSTDELRMGREVALAVMSGAAFELRQLDGGDPTVDELHEVVTRVRYGVAAGGGP